MRQTVFGIFERADDAQNAVKQLLDNGFTEANIDVRAKGGADAKSSHYDKTSSSDSDGFSNFFSNLFGSNHEDTRSYSEVARRGSVVTVHTASAAESERAARILDEYGAVDASEKAREYRTTEGRDTATTAKDSGQSIPVIEEEMEIGKREVETGAVRLRSRIIERPVEEKLRLREEHVTVNRTPVDRPATDKDFSTFKEGETEITEHAEVPVVNKEARVVEEVNLNKETRDRERTVRDTVRKTDVDVKQTTNEKDIGRRDR